MAKFDQNSLLMHDRENLLRTSGGKNAQVEADLLPVISQKGGSGK